VAISNGAGDFTIGEILVAPPCPGEVRVRLSAAGLCHTDIASLNWAGPLVMGHEGAGYIEAIGADVKNLAIGMPVLLNWAIPCAACPQCIRGREALCDRTLATNPIRFGKSSAHQGATIFNGSPIERSFHLGTFSEYTVVNSAAVTPLPQWLAPEQACILGCAVMTGVGSVINAASVMPGDTVAVLGCGGVGLSVIVGAHIAGASKIIAIDRNPDRLSGALDMGVTDTVLACDGADDHDQMVAAVKALTECHGVDHAFEATGRAELAFLPLRLARNRGNAVQLCGSHGAALVSMTDLFWNKRYIVPLYGNCVPSRDFPRLFEWVRTGQIDLSALVSREYHLAELGNAIEDMEAVT
jgi:S-(hydroxymethyl)glutathione dehydrogenase / alcohol dehydrogenase